MAILMITLLYMKDLNKPWTLAGFPQIIESKIPWLVTDQIQISLT